MSDYMYQKNSPCTYSLTISLELTIDVSLEDRDGKLYDVIRVREKLPATDRQNPDSFS